MTLTLENINKRLTTAERDVQDFADFVEEQQADNDIFIDRDAKSLSRIINLEKEQHLLATQKFANSLSIKLSKLNVEFRQLRQEVYKITNFLQLLSPNYFND
jgi:SMC interacting uncharacterized protein involved in chromosome segregation